MPKDTLNSEDEELTPSRAGIGMRFKIPRFRTQKGDKGQKGIMPSWATLPAICATPIGPATLTPRFAGKDLTQAIHHSLHDTAFR